MYYKFPKLITISVGEIFFVISSFFSSSYCPLNFLPIPQSRHLDFQLIHLIQILSSALCPLTLCDVIVVFVMIKPFLTKKIYQQFRDLVFFTGCFIR